MARISVISSILVFVIFTCVVAASSNSTNTPITNPTWPTDFPTSDSIEPRQYQDQKFNETFRCSLYRGVNFNLAEIPDCGTQLSQDLYGWGVRIGFYTTWFASLFANFFLIGEIRAAIDANSIFLFALEVSVAKATFRDKNLMKVDALILFLIGNGTAIGALSLWGRRSKFWYTDATDRKGVAKEFGGIGTYARLLLCFFIGLYGVWFWYSPSKPNLLRAGSCDPRCWTAYIFGVRLYTGVRWLFFVFALISWLYWAGMIFLAFVCSFPPSRKIWRAWYAKIHNRFSRILVSTGLVNLPTKWVRVILPAINLAWYVLIITIVEVTLHQNRALGTLITAKASTSPAQLIPFLVGVVSLGRLIWVKCTDGYTDEYKTKDGIKKLNPFVVGEEENEKNRAQSDSFLRKSAGDNERGSHTGDSK